MLQEEDGSLNPLNFPRLTCNLKQTEQKRNKRQNQGVEIALSLLFFVSRLRSE